MSGDRNTVTAADFFEFKDRVESRLTEMEALDADLVRAREEVAALRFDVTRTHRVVLELQRENRLAHKQLLAKLEQFMGSGVYPNGNGTGGHES